LKNTGGLGGIEILIFNESLGLEEKAKINRSQKDYESVNST
jgi:hypothetical protein